MKDENPTFDKADVELINPSIELQAHTPIEQHDILCETAQQVGFEQQANGHVILESGGVNHHGGRCTLYRCIKCGLQSVHKHRMEFEKCIKDMSFSQFQAAALSSAIYPNRGSNFIYPALGLAGEAGEVCEKIKKVIRDKGGQWSDEDKEAVAKEIGDVLWYAAALADELDLDLQDIAEVLIRKLTSRKQRGKLRGSGDNR